MNIAIVHMYPFPVGMAATARIMAYSKGLVANGANVTSYCLNPYYKKGGKVQLEKNGTYEGVNYSFTGSVYKANNPFVHKIQVLISIFNSLFILLKRRKDTDFLIISSDSPLYLPLYTLWAKLIGVRPVFITDEYPIPIRVHLKKDIPAWKKKMYKYVLKRQDSLIFMTEKLSTFYNSELKKPYHILPTITDTSRFDIEVEPADKKYMCYMGNMELSKDNVDNIIRAFAMISHKHPDLDFYLYGAPSPKDKAIIEGVIKECKMENRVFIKGRVAATEVPAILKKAYLLVSSQPNTKRAEGGFPTKLGEYMATGIPTILTDVGEISQYVKDGVHVHIVPPEQPEPYAEKLDWMLNNYDKSLEIAKNAKDYLYNTFDYNIVSSNLYDFFKKRMSEDLK